MLIEGPSKVILICGGPKKVTLEMEGNSMALVPLAIAILIVHTRRGPVSVIVHNLK